MIYNHWYVVLESKEVKKGKAVGATRMGEKMVFWRDHSGNVCAVSDLCAHRGASLSKGCVNNNHIECPFHGFRYDSSGKCQLIPANGKNAKIPENFLVKSYIVKEAYGFIWIWWGEKKDELPPVPFFDELKEGFSYKIFVDQWTVHYSRCIENQLDVVHLPFVHRTTIGRGGKTIVDGPYAELIDNEIRVWVYNRLEDGIPGRKPSELERPEILPMLYFKFPCIWRLNIGPFVSPFLAFVPVDEENTLIYMRYYHKITNLPLVKDLIGFLGILSSIVILRQDKRVVINQMPKKTDIHIGENLIQGDYPIVLYRKHRSHLQQKLKGDL